MTTLVSIAQGGTGANNATQARLNLGITPASTLNVSANGGTTKLTETLNFINTSSVVINVSNAASTTNVSFDVIAGLGFVRDSFVGDGNEVDFTLSGAPVNEDNSLVFVDRVLQRNSEYNVSATTLTFTAAPDNGSVIDVFVTQYLSGNAAVLRTGDTMTGELNVSAKLITQNIEPAANITYNLGTNTKRFKDLWLSNSTIYLGEATISANGNALVIPSIESSSGNLSSNNVTAERLYGSNNNGDPIIILRNSAANNAISFNANTLNNYVHIHSNGVITASGVTSSGNLSSNNVTAERLYGSNNNGDPIIILRNSAADNAVTFNANTSNNYVHMHSNGVISASGITISGLNLVSQTAGAYGQANLAYAAANNSNLKLGGLVSGTLNVTQDLIVGGNIYLEGNTTYINVATYSVEDSLIYMASNNSLTDSVDIGFMGGKNTDGSYAHTGFARDATDGKWKLFDGLAEEGHVGNVVDFANTYLATLVANVEANTLTVVNGVTGNVNFDSGTLFVDSVGNKIGIGTTNPQGKLDIRSSGLDTNVLTIYGTTNNAKMFDFRDDDAAGTAAMFRMYNRDGAETLRLFPGTNSIHHSWILPQGNVGIGTTNPSGKFHTQATNSGIYFDLSSAYAPKIIASGALSDLQLEAVGNGGNIISKINGAASYFMWFNGATETMRLNGSGNLGIGTTSPNSNTKLDVLGALGFQRVNTTLTSGNDASGLIYVRQNGNSAGTEEELRYLARNHRFFDHLGQTLLSISSEGKIGIGTTNPSIKLDVWSGSGDYIAQFRRTDWQGGGTPRIAIGKSLAVTGYIQSDIVEYVNDTAYIALFYKSGLSTYSEGLRVHNNGNVGIGTTNPAGKLDVYGGIYINGSEGVSIYGSTSGVQYKVVGGNGSGRGAVSYYDLRNPAPRDFRNGTMAFLFTAYNFDGSGGGWADALAMCSYTDGTGGDPNIFAVNRSTSGVKVSRQSYDSATSFSSGTIYTLNYTSASDASVKEDVQEITNGLSIITQLRPVTFKWTDEYILNGMSKNSGENVIDQETGQIILPEEKAINVGLIAQEVEAVLPTVVHQENVKLKDAENYLKNINYDKLVPHLIAAVKEQQSLIELLQSRIETLESTG